MKPLKYLSIFLLLSTIIFNINSKNSFFLNNRTGILIKVDPASGIKPILPKKKGPRLDEIPKEMKIEKFEEEILGMITDENDKNTVLSYYTKDESSDVYIIKPENDNLRDLTVIRKILMYYNKDNEIKTGLDIYGAPSPHKFPRNFEPKTKANFDIHFVWGVRFDNFYTKDNYKLGRLVLGFSLNLTNFLMPSIEFSLKYNFFLPDYPIEPYVGAVFYGGFLDGFPYGLSAIGGVDVFPMHYEDRPDNRNLFVLGELRLGAVMFQRLYYDTGVNSEGIWKSNGLGFLAEGGIYTGVGYIWDNELNQ